MAFENQNFHLSGPRDLTHVDWKNADHARSVTACLVKAVYVLERDRQEKREGPEALAPPWWETFGFQLQNPIVDAADSSIFGAIFEYKPPQSSGNHSADGPRFVVAFRGTLIERETVVQDVIEDARCIWNKLHSSPRFETAMQAVENWVTTAGDSRVVWLAGHSLGSAIALLAGKNMAKKGSKLESYLFNPPYLSVIGSIKNKKWKRALQFCANVASSLRASKKSPEQLKQSHDSFVALSRWVPRLFVNAADYICSGYIDHFEHGKWMRKIGLGYIQRIASQHSVKSLILSKNGTQAEPFHFIPSADLTINSNPPKEFLEAHTINEWWKQDLKLKSKVYKYDN